MNKVTISGTFLVTNFVKNLEMAREQDGRYGKTKGWFWTKCVWRDHVFTCLGLSKKIGPCLTCLACLACLRV